MSATRALFAGCALLFLGLASARPQDIPVRDDGRYDGEVVVLMLSDEQTAFLAHPPQGQLAGALTLTAEQSASIKERFETEITRLKIVDTRTQRPEGCACLMANTAFRFADGQVEVPQALLQPEKDALALWKFLDDSAAEGAVEPRPADPPAS